MKFIIPPRSPPRDRVLAGRSPTQLQYVPHYRFLQIFRTAYLLYMRWHNARFCRKSKPLGGTGQHSHMAHASPYDSFVIRCSRSLTQPSMTCTFSFIEASLSATVLSIFSSPSLHCLSSPVISVCCFSMRSSV